MRFTLALTVLAFAAAPAWAQTPTPRINIALELDGRLVAATTTLEDGQADLVAERDGEYGLVLQSDLPAESVLTATVGPQGGAEEYSVVLAAGAPQVDAALAFPALAGQAIRLRLTTTEGDPGAARPAHDDGLPGLLPDPAD